MPSLVLVEFVSGADYDGAYVLMSDGRLKSLLAELTRIQKMLSEVLELRKCLSVAHYLFSK
jgi:hypothetical protein